MMGDPYMEGIMNKKDPKRMSEWQEQSARHLTGCVDCGVVLLRGSRCHDCEMKRIPPRMWAVFHKPTGKQLCKAQYHREIAIIEAYELGLIVRARGHRWLSRDYEIR